MAVKRKERLAKRRTAAIALLQRNWRWAILRLHVRNKAKERADNEQAGTAVLKALDEAAEASMMRTAYAEAQRLAHYFEDEQPWNQLLSDAMVKAGPRLKELETEAAAKRRAEQWRSLLSHFKCLPTKCLPGSS